MCNEQGAECGQVTYLRGPEISGIRWSPKGNSILFSAVDAGDKSQLHMIEDMSKVRRVRPDKYDQVHGAWSRNGGWIYFGSSRSGKFQIWKMAVAGANVQPVSVTVNGGYEALESPDGRTLFYVKKERQGLWKVAVTGGDETLVADSVIPDLWDSIRSWNPLRPGQTCGEEALFDVSQLRRRQPKCMGFLPKNFSWRTQASASAPMAADFFSVSWKTFGPI